MEIKDDNGKVIANIDLQEGFNISDLIKSISAKKTKSSLNELVEIFESENKKQIVFKFNDGEIYYDLPTKYFLRKNGLKIGEGSFKSIKLEVNSKTVKDNSSDRHYSYEVEDFWLQIENKTSVPWIKTFFKLVHIWANNRHNRNWMNNRDKKFRTKIQRLNEDKKFFDCLEIFSKIPKIQSLDDRQLCEMYKNMLSCSTARTAGKQKLPDSFCVDLSKIKLDKWFLSNCDKYISETYSEEICLINFLGDYAQCVNQGLKDEFKYVFETYRGVILSKQIEKIKILISKFDYEPKRLMDYLYRDIYNQALELDMGQGGWRNSLGALGTLHDYAEMNHDMKKEYEKYPRYLTSFHDIARANYEIHEDKILVEKFNERVDELKNNNFEYEDEDYVIVLPRDSKDLMIEGQSLSHCVASYYKRMAKGETNIVFLRKKKEKNTSLVTIEIKEHQIVQAKGVNNTNPASSEASFIDKYARHLKGLKNE